MSVWVASKKHKVALRNVRKTLLEVVAANETTASGKLSELVAETEDLVDELGGGSHIQAMLYVLAFEYEGTTTTHAAIVLE